MAAEDGRLKSLVFKMKTWQLALLLAFSMILIATLGIFAIQAAVPKAPFYFFMVLFLIIITLNGNSIMNEGGLDIASFLHFGITVVFGIFAGFLTVFLTTAAALYIATIKTPIDFFVQKNIMKVLIQTTYLICTTTFLWIVISLYGIDIIYAKLAIIYILAFTAGRAVKGTLLVTIGQVPFMKVLVTTVLFYIINWYAIQLLGMPFLSFLKVL